VSELPEVLFLVRHGESAGNLARELAERDGREVIDIAPRDMDVPLSALGERQAAAVGRWLAERPPDQRPDVVIASPYVRAVRTAEIAVAAGLEGVEIQRDERLREREFGILDRLTRAGIVRCQPEQAELRARVGKFYHRPPGGESWCDVGLRVRSFLASLAADHPGRRVMLVAHQVPILMTRYVLERLGEPEILAVEKGEPLVNCSVGLYERDPTAGALVRRLWNHQAPVAEAGEPVTAEPSEPVAPR
jgi:broad specificity phosphatase PhoE